MAEQRERQSGQRRLLRGAGWTVLGLLLALLVFGLGGVLSLTSETGERWLRDTLVEELRRTYPGLRLERLELNLPDELVLTDLRLADRQGDEVIAVPKIVVDYEYWPLFSQTLALEALQIEEPSLRVAQDEQGRWNVAQLKARQPPEEEESAWDVVVEGLRLTGGELLLQPRQQPQIQLRQLVLRGEATFRGEQVMSVELPELRARYQAKELKGRLEASLQAELAEERVDSQLKAQLTPAEGEAIPVLVSAEGPLDQVKTLLRIGAQPEPLVRIAGTVDLRRPAYDLQGEINQLENRPLPAAVPSALINLQLAASGRGVPLQPGSSAQLRLSSAGLTVADQQIDQLELVAEAEGLKWQLEQLAVTGPALRIRASGQGRALETFQLQGRLAAQGFGPVQVQGRSLRLRGTARVAAERGEDEQLTLAASTDLKRLALGQLQLRGLQSELEGQLQPRQGKGTLALATTSPFRLNGQRVRSLSANVRADGEQLVLQARVAPAVRGARRIKPARLEATLPLQRGSFRPARDQALRASLSWPNLPARQLARLAGLEQRVRGRITIWGVARGTLNNPRLRARLTLSDGRLASLRQLAGRVQLQVAPQGTVARLRARLGPKPFLWGELVSGAGPQALLQSWRRVPFTLQARLSPLDPKRLAQLGPPLDQLRGRLQGSLSARGPLLRPRAELTVNLERRFDGRLRQLQANLEASGRPGQTRVEGLIRAAGQRVLSLEASTGSSPLRLAQLPLDRPRWRVRANIERTSLDSLSTFFPPLDLVGGELSGQVQLAGTLPLPRGGARLRVAQLSARGRKLGDLQSRVVVQPQLAHLRLALEQQQGRGLFTFDLDQAGRTNVSLLLRRLDLGPLREIYTIGETLTKDRVSAKLVAHGTIDSPAKTALGRLLQPELITGEIELEDVLLAANLL